MLKMGNCFVFLFLLSLLTLFHDGQSKGRSYDLHKYKVMKSSRKYQQVSPVVDIKLIQDDQKDKKMRKQGYHKNFMTKSSRGWANLNDDKPNLKKKKKFSPSKAQWLAILNTSDCNYQCLDKEVCIMGPLDKKPMCIHKRNLKKSVRLFNRYRKKEMKAWKQYQKKHHGKDFKNVDKEMFKSTRQDKNVNKSAWKQKNHGKKFSKVKTHKKFKYEKNGFKPFLVEKMKHAKKGSECSTSQYSQMRTRLMGWFHLLHGQQQLVNRMDKGHSHKIHKHISVKKELRQYDGKECPCLKSAMWQFNEMDTNQDDHLDDEELNMIEENSLEPCAKPYLNSCDLDADRRISADEWCCCFSNVVAPCYKKVDEIRRSGMPVTYMPRCDREGYFMREQCSNDGEDSMTCWCVDYNGNVYKGTSKKGRAHCAKAAKESLGKAPLF